MLSKAIIETAKLLLRQLVNLTGGIIPLPDWAQTGLNYILSAVANGANMLKWIIPNEYIYNSILAIAISLLTVWVVSKIVGFAIRLYDLLLV